MKNVKNDSNEIPKKAIKYISNNNKNINSYNIKKKLLSIKGNNSSVNQEKNIFEDLLSDDTKSTDNSSNKIININ